MLLLKNTYFMIPYPAVVFKLSKGFIIVFFTWSPIFMWNISGEYDMIEIPYYM